MICKKCERNIPDNSAHCPYCGVYVGNGESRENIFKKVFSDKLKTTIILYIIAVVIQCTLIVPCHRIEVFISEQNVPHSEITRYDYYSLSDITGFSRTTSDDEYFRCWQINYEQLYMQLTLTTITAVLIYIYLLQQRKNKTDDAIEKLNAVLDAHMKTEHLSNKNIGLKLDNVIDTLMSQQVKSNNAPSPQPHKSVSNSAEETNDAYEIEGIAHFMSALDVWDKAFDAYSKLMDEYGMIEPGENPARDVQAPKKMDIIN